MKLGYEIKYLVTMLPQRDDSWMFHYPNIHLTELFAEAVGIPLAKAETTGVKEKELEDLKRLLATLNIEGVVSGAISSRYQKERIDQTCKELRLKSLAPLWHEPPTKLLEEIVNLKMHVIIVGVYAYGFDQTWLGRQINQATISQLAELNKKYQVSLVGEGGEYETLVLDAPFFKKKIKLIETEKIWEKQCGHLHVKKAILAEK